MLWGYEGTSVSLPALSQPVMFAGQHTVNALQVASEMYEFINTITIYGSAPSHPDLVYGVGRFALY